jgi:hypothetical protein
MGAFPGYFPPLDPLLVHRTDNTHSMWQETDALRDFNPLCLLGSILLKKSVVAAHDVR